MRWLAIGLLAAASSAASAFASGTARVVAVVIASVSAVLLAYWGARTERRLDRSEIRVEEAHERLLELTEQLDVTALHANAAHVLASLPVRQRQIDEDYANIVKPIEEDIGRLMGRMKALFTRAGS